MMSLSTELLELSRLACWPFLREASCGTRATLLAFSSCTRVSPSPASFPSPSSPSSFPSSGHSYRLQASLLRLGYEGVVQDQQLRQDAGRSCCPISSDLVSDDDPSVIEWSHYRP